MTLSLFGAPRGARLRAAPASSFRPSVEALEDRALPSFVPGLIHGVTPTAHVSHAMKLVGNVSGTWAVQSSLIADVGTTQALHGSGNLPGLGAFQVSGTISTPGFISSGYTHGTLRLTNVHGSVTLQLVSVSPQSGFSGPASGLHYTIVSGTGSYAGATGSGSAALREKPAQQVHTGTNGSHVTTIPASFGFSFS
jgi:hypothetical protein